MGFLQWGSTFLVLGVALFVTGIKIEEYNGAPVSSNISDSLRSLLPKFNFTCTNVGSFPDPEDESKYYICSFIGNQYYLTHGNCPPTTCFDKVTKVCTYFACGELSYSCLKDNLAENSQLVCAEETLDLLKKSLSRYIDASATRGDPLQNYLLSLRDIHWQMRANYGNLIQGVGKNIYPLIVATDSDTPELSGVGGAYKLYLQNGTMKRIVPVPKDFDMHKCLSHIVLGIFATISPYFRTPESRNWRPSLIQFQEKVKDAMHALPLVPDDADLSIEDREHALTMLMMVDTYLSECLRTNSVDYMIYHNFATMLAPYIDKSMQKAAKVHAAYTLPALQQWKEELGDEWEKTYVIIPTVWPVSKINIRLQMFEKVMSFKQIKENVLIVEGARSEDDARTTLGRVVADRALAQLVFGGIDDDNMRDHMFSLSTRRDLLSTEASKAIDEYCNEKPVEEERCPVAQMYATMLRTV